MPRLERPKQARPNDNRDNKKLQTDSLADLQPKRSGHVKRNAGKTRHIACEVLPDSAIPIVWPNIRVSPFMPDAMPAPVPHLRLNRRLSCSAQAQGERAHPCRCSSQAKRRFRPAWLTPFDGFTSCPMRLSSGRYSESSACNLRHRYFHWARGDSNWGCPRRLRRCRECQKSRTTGTSDRLRLK